jgi:hypothetical protein
MVPGGVSRKPTRLRARAPETWGYHSELDVMHVDPKKVDDGLRLAGVLELGRLSLLGVAKLVLPQAAEGISVLAGVQRARQRSH